MFVCNFGDAHFQETEGGRKQRREGEGDAGGQQQQLLQQGGQAAGWEAQVDEASGQTYYINSQTGESQWEPPQ